MDPQQFSLGTIDIVIMLVYGVAIIGYGLYHAKRKDSEEYFLGGRSMTWPIVGISLFAANISSSTLVGLASDAFVTNTHVYNYEWLAAVVLVFFAVFFLPFYLSSQVYTMPEFLERRYDARSRYYFSLITLIGNVIVDTAAGLYVGMLVMKIFFPELSTPVIVAILAVAAAAYTIPGGLSSVIHTEVVQAILLLVGSIVLTIFAFQEVGGWDGMITGLEAMKGQAPVGDQTPEEILSLIRPSSDEYMPWTALLFGAPILGFYFWANNQFMVQRVLGAKDLNHGRWGAIFAGALKLPVLFFMVFPGTVAIVLYSDLDLSFLNYYIENDLGEKVLCTNLKDCSNMTYPVLLFKLLPQGLLGLVLAGLLAAMMSSVSATFNSASTLITMDFVRKINPDLTSEQLVRVGQIATVVLVILASAWAPQIEKFGSLFEYLQRVLAYICPPVVAVFVTGLFSRRVNSNGAFVSLLIGFGFAVVLLVLQVMGQTPDALTGIWAGINDINFLHKALFLFIICLGIHLGVSYATAPPDQEKIADYIYTKDVFQEDSASLKGLPWYKNYRVWAAILLAVTAVIVGYFA
ncbi:MAG: sodium:solute symporter [Bacteroidota bacterium]